MSHPAYRIVRKTKDANAAVVFVRRPTQSGWTDELALEIDSDYWEDVDVNDWITMAPRRLPSLEGRPEVEQNSLLADELRSVRLESYGNRFTGMR